MKTDTIIKVGQVRDDEYGNRWVTPHDGGDDVKIGSKRAHLHNLFQQGNTISLHWETYKGKSYVGNAELISGETEAEQEQTNPTTSKPAQKRYGDDTNRSIEKQVALKGAIEITKALIESKTWGKDDLTIPNINATIKKIANSNDEWLMSSQKVVEKIVEEIEN